jgi:adenine deaminase
MSTTVQSFIDGLPKCELHVHLEGTLEPALARQLAVRNKLSIPEDVGSSDSQEGYSFWDLTSFLKVYYRAMSCLITADDFSDLAYAYLTKAHSQNIIHAEMFFDPQAHTSRGIEFDTVLSGLTDGLRRARADFDISAKLIMCFLRDHSAESAEHTLSALLKSPYLKEVVGGVGLDSDEKNNPPLKFRSVFAKAKEAGLRITIHCDVDQPNSIEHIRQAIHDIGVDRIDHGTNIIENGSLVEDIRRKGIGLTCCPISNSIVCSDFKGQEMKHLLSRGVKITINSDDPAYFRGYLTENLTKMLEAGFDLQNLARTQQNALEIAWVNEETRLPLLAKLHEFVKANLVL